MGSASDFSLRLEARNGVVRIALGGELDIASAPALAESLADAEQDGIDAIMLDLRDLTFIDSTGLHALLKASERAKANGHGLVIVGANRMARQLFELTGTEYLIDEKDVVSVLDRFTGGQAQRASESAVERRGDG